MALKDLKGIVPEGGIASWVRWSIREKGLVLVAVLAFVGLGLFGLSRMNKDEFPVFQLKQGLVAGIYPGATAAEVEAQLTGPLEEYLFTFKEVDRRTVRSVTRDGICYIYVDLGKDVPQARKDEIWSKIKLGLQARKLTLPTGVLAVAVLDDFGSTSAMLITLESTDKSYQELQEYADELCERLHRLPQLASASVVGAQQEEIAVTIDREKLSAYGIDPAQLFLEYRAASFSVPAGAVETGSDREAIHVTGTVGSEREVAERIVYADPLGNVVRLRDIAQISRRFKEPQQEVSYNGHSCLIINVEMRPDNDIVGFGDKVEGVLSAYRETLPPSVSLGRICDQPQVVGRSVWSFLRDLLISMLVVIAVMLMLFPIRSALIASSGVPVCTGVAIAVMYLTGMPLNTVTLAALIVVLGMIVDDSIITMDGYMNQQGQGFTGINAAARSAQELFMPTFIATLAICLMFFPIKLIITGYLGDFVSLFPWVVLIALMMSMFYAVTVVPSLEVKYIVPQAPGARKGFVARAQDRFFDGLQRFYETCLAWCFRHPYLTLFGGVATIVLGALMFSRLEIQMLPKAARNYFVVEMYERPGKSIRATRARADSLGRILREDDRVLSVTAFVGTGAPRFSATYTPILPSPQTAQLIVTTRSTHATEQVLRECERRYEHLFPDAEIRFKQMDFQPVDAPISVQFRGGKREDLLPAAEKAAAYLRSLPTETQWVHSDAEDWAPVVDVTLDGDEASRLGVSKALLSLSLGGTFGGETIATVWEDNRAVPVNIYSEPSGEEAVYRTLGDQWVPTAVPTVSVPLRQVASVTPGWQLDRLCREGGTKSVGAYCDLKFGVSQPAVEKKLRKYVREEIEPTLPEGVEVVYSGLTSINAQVIPEIGWSFFAACSILFLFLLMHFRKASLALLTMVLSSLCLFGASFGLWVFGLDFSITAVLGLISLVGIIVRNGILLFEYAEEARFDRGESVRDAAYHAGERRMRPIFLTSCTTALGVLPMILSGDLLWMPMGVTICFGTLLTIFLITLVMPVSYWQLNKKADKS